MPAAKSKLTPEQIAENFRIAQEAKAAATIAAMPALIAYYPPPTFNPTMYRTVVVVAPENRVTSNVMSLFEFAQIIAVRAKEITDGGICFTDVDGISKPEEMAKKELRDKRCPLTVVRHLYCSDNTAHITGDPRQIVEHWPANEMTIAEFIHDE